MTAPRAPKTLVLIATAAMAVMVGCASPAAPAAGVPGRTNLASTSGPTPALTPEPTLASATAAAATSMQPSSSVQKFLDAWGTTLAASGVPPLVITSPLDGQIGDWENAVGGNNKIALINGSVRAGRGVAAEPQPADQPVTWLNGQRRVTPVVTAAAAIGILVAEGSAGCSACAPVTPLVLDDPRLIRHSISTATGAATIPVWSFGVVGSEVRVTVAAMSRSSLVQRVPGLPTGQIWDSMSTVHESTGGALTISFVGAEAGTGPCQENYTGRLVEADRAVAVLIDTAPKPSSHPASDSQTSCDAVGHLRSVRVQPARALAGRVIIDGHSGLALPLV